MRKLIIFIFFAIASLSQSLIGQCKITNTFFQAGEQLTYELYFKYGLLYMKAGISTLTTSEEVYNGQKAFKTTLLAESTGTARKFFALNDTLVGYTTKDLVPLAFVKDAHEGDDYTHELITYKYGAPDIKIQAQRTKNGTQRYDEALTSTECIYDMATVVVYARTLDYNSMKKGDSKDVQFMSGKNKVLMSIEHNGVEKIKMNDGKKYECIQLILNIRDDAFADKKEAMIVYITNDKNRLPIRLDSKLKVGSTRAILKSFKGNLYPVQTY